MYNVIRKLGVVHYWYLKGYYCILSMMTNQSIRTLTVLIIIYNNHRFFLTQIYSSWWQIDLANAKINKHC